jgi:nitric oxide synthase-interacting protein
VGKAANERYICPLTKKALSNVNPACVLRPSGKVVSLACVKDFIKKDMIDPFTDPPTKLREKDIIELRCEGTGFAARTKESALKVTTAKPYGF